MWGSTLEPITPTMGRRTIPTAEGESGIGRFYRRNRRRRGVRYTAGMRQAAEHGDHVTPDMLRAEIAALHGAIAELRADMYRAMLLQTGVTVGAIVALLRLLD